MSNKEVLQAYQDGALILVANLGVQHRQIEALREENRALKKTLEGIEPQMQGLKARVEKQEEMDKLLKHRVSALELESANIRQSERDRIARWLEEGAGEKEQHWNEVYAKKLREMK